LAKRVLPRNETVSSTREGAPTRQCATANSAPAALAVLFGARPSNGATIEEPTLKTMTVHEAARRFSVQPPRSPRRPHAATIVAALYVLFVLGAPGIVRYAPDPDLRWLSAVTAPQPQIRCASMSAPSPCQPYTVAAAGSVTPAH